jgi:hypothetical protein
VLYGEGKYAVVREHISVVFGHCNELFKWGQQNANSASNHKEGVVLILCWIRLTAHLECGGR